MKRKYAIAAMIFIGIASAQICWPAQFGYHNLKFDIQYMFKWTAQKMGIHIDIKKQMPKVAFASGQYINDALEKKYGLKKKYELYEKTIVIDIQYEAFYCPEEKTIYIRNDLDSEQDEPVECWIVHEIVHFFQHNYRGAIGNTQILENEARKISKKFFDEHYTKKAR